MRHRHTARCLRLVAVAGLISAAGTVLLTDRADADTTRFLTFDARAAAAIYDFSVLVPDALPVEVPGGVLASTAQARQGPKAFGSAGVAPIPTLTSIGLIIPQKDPVTGQPIPQQFQNAAASIDYTKLPGYCQAAFPTSPGTTTTAQCGGPSQNDPALGFTADGSAGRVTAVGDEDDDASATTTAISRGAGAGITAASAQVANYDATATSSLNSQGIPEAVAKATIAGFSLLGNTVRLDGIASATDLAFDGTKNGFAGTTSFSLQQASIFGVPVHIGPEGFSIADQNPANQSGMAGIVKQFNDVLHVQDFTLRIFPATPLQREGSKVSMSSAGVEFSYLRDEIRYTGRVGLSTASVVAVPTGTVTAGGGVAGVADVGETSPSSGTATVAGLDGIAAGTDGPVPTAAGPETLATEQVPVGSGIGTAQTAGNRTLLTGLQVSTTSSLPDHRLQQLYLAFAALIGAAALLTRVRSLSALRAVRR